MRSRFVRIAIVLAALTAIVVPTALALGFDPYNPNLPDATQGVPYSFQLTARAGCPPYSYSVISGSLPPGIQLASGGNFNGSATGAGTYGFYVDLKDNCNFHAQRPFSLTVIKKVTVTSSASLAQGTVGVPYSLQLTADGAGAYVWSVSGGALPAGMTLSDAGVLAGTPTAAGTTSFTVQAKDSLNSARTDTKQLTIEILAPLIATVGAPPAAEVGIAFKGITPAATGGKPPYTWSVSGNLPAGLTVDPATGAINGTPSGTGGSFATKLVVTDANKTTATIDIPLIVARPLALVTVRLPSIKVGGTYQATVRTRGGVSPIKWKVTSGKFPVGIRLDTKTGILSGSPKKAGVFTITVTVTDKLGATAEQNYTFEIKAKPKVKKAKA